MLCQAGATRLRRREGGARVLLAHARRAGGNCDAEVAVPELYEVDAQGQVHERIMDVVVDFPGGGRRFLLDCTVRSPFAAEAFRPTTYPPSQCPDRCSRQPLQS